MSGPSTTGIFNSFVRQLKRLSGKFTEKPAATIEDYVLEHILLYHGLVGSSPDDQPEFRDVRSDICSAIDKRSSGDLSIALKLAPLRWEDRLQSIFAELQASNRQATVATLLHVEDLQQAPADETCLEPSQEPLQHEDWQVRSNAASMLAFLNVPQAVPRLAKALKDASQGTAQASFCHIAYALGRLGTPAAHQVLIPFLFDSEPWFRVDAARSLCLWPQEVVAHELMNAMLSPHPFSDYMALVIARQFTISDWLESKDPQIRSGALEVISGVIQASAQTFPADIVLETNIHHCWPQLAAAADSVTDATWLAATLHLGRWLQNNPQLLAQSPANMLNISQTELKAQIEYVLAKFHSAEVRNALLQQLLEIDPAASDKGSTARRTIEMIGELEISSAHAKLLTLLKPEFSDLDQTLGTLGKLGNPDAAPEMIDLCKQLIDISQRVCQAEVEQPITEEQPEKSRTYWLILKALGNLPSPETLSFLLQASNDFAPDKRQQALESLLTSTSRQELSQLQRQQIEQLIYRRLDDPSVPVKMVALDGIAQFSAVEHLAKLVKLGTAKESSLARHALKVLRQLSDKGFKQQVQSEVETAAKSQFSSDRRQLLVDFAQSLE